MSKGTRKKIGLFAGVGCAALAILCCGGMALAFHGPRSRHLAKAKEHAERFLGHVQAHDYAAAYADTEYLGRPPGPFFDESAAFRSCLASTVLNDVVSYSCDDVDAPPWAGFGGGGGAVVTCTVTSAAHGASEISLDVRSVTSSPYLDTVWFSPSAWVGPEWPDDRCTSWSGRDREPPPGRIRP